MKGIWKRTLSCLMAVIFLFTSLNVTVLAGEEGYIGEASAEGDLNSAGEILGQEQYTVRVEKKGKGSISPEGEQAVLSDSVLSIAMMPDHNYKVAQIKVDGNPISAEETAWADSMDQYDFWVSGNQTVEIIFGAELSVSGHTYTVVGPEKLCEKEQDPEAYQNDMAEDDWEIGTFKLEYKHIPMGTYSFKISKDHSTMDFYAEGSVVEVPVDDATVTITFKEETQKVSTEVKDVMGNVVATSGMEDPSEGESETTDPWQDMTEAETIDPWQDMTEAETTDPWQDMTEAETTDPWQDMTEAETTDPWQDTTEAETAGSAEWDSWTTETLVIPEESSGDVSEVTVIDEARVEITQNENGSILPEGWSSEEKPSIYSVESGSDVTFVITPAEGYVLSGLVADFVQIDVSTLPDGEQEGQKKYTFYGLTGTHSIDAAFLPKESSSIPVSEAYRIQVISGNNGRIVPEGTLSDDNNYYVTGQNIDDVTFSVVPYDNCYIASLTVDGEAVDVSTLADTEDGKGKMYTFRMAEGTHSIAAEFAENSTPSIPHKIQVIQGENGTISPSGELAEDNNYYVTGETAEDVSFTIVPNDNYSIKSITVDGTAVELSGLYNTEDEKGKIYTFSQVEGDHSITAEFAEVQIIQNAYRIQVVTGSNGTISPSGELAEDNNYYVTGETAEDVSFEIVPSDNYYISSLVIDTSPIDLDLLPDTADGKGKVYTFSQAQGDHVIMAEFTEAPSDSHRIHVIQSENGTISPAGDAEGYVEVVAGNSCTFTITPNAGYKVATVVADSVEYSADSLPNGLEEKSKIYTFDSVESDGEIYAVFEQEQPSENIYIIQAESREGGTIDPSGKVEVKADEDQTFIITPSAGYSILSVEIDGIEMLPEELDDGPEDGTKQFTFGKVSANHSIVAKFQADQPASYTVTSVAGANGTISPLGEQSVTSGDLIRFDIQPNSGYHIDSVKVDGVELTGDELAKVRTEKTYTFENVTEDHKLEVTFAADSQPVRTYTIKSSAGSHGSISPSGTITVEEGATAVYTITSESDYHISDVIVDGIRIIGDELAYIVNTGKYTFVNVNKDHTIQVLFEKNGAPVIYHTIISSAGSNGTISPLGATTVLDEDNQTYIIIPDKGYRVASVMIDGVRLTGTALERVQKTQAYTFYDVTKDHSIAVGFTKIAVPVTTYTIQSYAGEHGSITPSGTIQVQKGASQTYQIQTEAGYHLAVVKIDGIELTGDSLKQVQNTGLYTFSNVAANHTIGVSFEKNENPVLTYNVIYLDEDGSEITNLSSYYDNYKSYVYGSGMIMPSIAPYQREGYNFLGWYTSMTGGTKVEVISSRDSGDKVVYARWTQNAIPMIFDDKESGVMLSGYFNGSPRLWVVTLTPGNKTYEELKKLPAMTGKKPINAFDISIIDGTFTGNMVLTFAVNEGYNGKTLTVIHKKTDGTFEVFTPVASNGKIVVNVTDLGSFMLAANDADYLMYGPNSSVKTGDAMASTMMSSIVMMICAGALIVVLAKKRKRA
ncbi:MAG: InlB B-repeat-containing protein [Robinsoniella sp.]|nr:InlB B-repeat-containing protein [Robinsoniella sp.]